VTSSQTIAALSVPALLVAARRGLAGFEPPIAFMKGDSVPLAIGAITAAFCAVRGAPLEAVLCFAMALCVITDLREGLIPDLVVGVALALIGAAAFEGGDLRACLIGGTTSFSAMTAIFVVSRGAMGAGDVKLAAVVGAALGAGPALVAIALAFVVGAATAIGLLASGRIRRGETMPFAPFLTVGALAVMGASFAGVPVP
jgi:prepilin signal peptidase PulO-like enzyme (type II secretory pathway)